MRITRFLCYFYLKKSLEFQLLKLTISSPAKTVHICHSLNISTSHFYRLLKKTNDFILKYKIALRFNSEGVLVFQGEELHIRIFMYNFITECISTKEWLFSSLNKTEMERFISHCFDSSSITCHTYHRLLIFCGIFYQRIYLKCFLGECDEQYKEVLEFYTFLDSEIVHSFFPSPLFLKESFRYTEVNYFNFLIRILIPDFITEKNQVELGKQLFNSKLPLTNFYIDLLEKWLNNSQITFSSRQYYCFIYNAVLIYNFSILITIDWQTDYILYDERVNIDLEKFDAIQSFLKKQVLSSTVSSLDKDFFLNHQLMYLSSLLYIEQKTITENNKINIYISIGKDYKATNLIKNKLNSVFNNEALQFVSSTSEAEIAVVDTITNVPSKRLNTILVSGYLKTNEWEQILTIICAEFLKKMF